MNMCYFDAFSGISGDMTVGALADAGADQKAIIAALQSLGTEASFAFERVKRRGFGATKFHVTVPRRKRHHRHLPGILRMIGKCNTPPRAKERAACVFESLGRAEAHIHQVPLEMVHFHEVGAADSIADIVGACVALELLGIDEILCSPVNVGSGKVNTEHGVLPVPAPATARLLQDRPIYTRGPSLELTTPTGAALASALASGFGVLPAMKVSATGFGAGSHDFRDHANVLRVVVGEPMPAGCADAENEILSRIEDLHGGRGVFTAAGYRIGMRALRDLGASRGSFTLDVTHRTPFRAQWSCIADGIQVATGASPGKLNLRLIEASEQALETIVWDRGACKGVSFRLQEPFLAKYLDTPPERQESAAREVLGLPESEIFTVEEKEGQP